jgi:hypothetical protein
MVGNYRRIGVIALVATKLKLPKGIANIAIIAKFAGISKPPKLPVLR